MTTTRLLVLALLWSGGDTSVSAGQTPMVAVGGAVGASFQEKGKSDSPYLGPGFGGTTSALVVFVDGLIASRVTVGGTSWRGTSAAISRSECPAAATSSSAIITTRWCPRP